MIVVKKSRFLMPVYLKRNLFLFLSLQGEQKDNFSIPCLKPTQKETYPQILVIIHNPYWR